MPGKLTFRARVIASDLHARLATETGRFNLNYLGLRRVICDGIRFTKVAPR
jgi:hypothetical protein